MSTTLEWQGCRVQLEQTNMHQAMGMTKMAKGGFSWTPIEETEYLIKYPCTEVRQEKKWGDECPGHSKVKAVIGRHPAMLCQNHTARCHPCLNGTA